MPTLNPVDKLNFLLGTWDMVYSIPKSSTSQEDKGEGRGEFKKTLNGKCVTFDYEAELTETKRSAHGIFSWDEKTNQFRYWWFEDSGAVMQADCWFEDEDMLYMEWQNTNLTQTFAKVNDDNVILRMENYSADEKSELVMEVALTRKSY